MVLDSGPTGRLTNPRASEENENCRRWLIRLAEAGVTVVLPEIVDYELRRELLRGERSQALDRLDKLKEHLHFVPLDSPTMLLAAQLWAEARQRGLPTADSKALDVDALLAAQTRRLETPDCIVTLATTNVGHLNQFVCCRTWEDIHPDQLAGPE